ANASRTNFRPRAAWVSRKSRKFSVDHSRRQYRRQFFHSRLDHPPAARRVGGTETVVYPHVPAGCFSFLYLLRSAAEAAVSLVSESVGDGAGASVPIHSSGIAPVSLAGRARLCCTVELARWKGVYGPPVRQSRGVAIRNAGIGAGLKHGRTRDDQSRARSA